MRKLRARLRSGALATIGCKKLNSSLSAGNVALLYLFPSPRFEFFRSISPNTALLRRALILFFFLFFWSTNGKAQYFMSTELPKSFYQSQFSLAGGGVGYACLNSSVFDSLPCNPAMISFVRESRLDAQVVFGNDYAAINQVQQLINAKPTQNFIQSLFKENHAIQMEGDTDVTFQAKHFGVRFSPYRISYFSLVQNSAYPNILLHARQETSLITQGGTKIADGLFAGMQIRALNRKVIENQFTLYDVLAQDGNKLIEPLEQKALYFEPSVTYIFETKWRPKFTIMGINTGFQNLTLNYLDTLPRVDYGIGITPPISWGKLEIELDYRDMNRESNFANNLHFGSSYSFGAMQLLLGLNTEALSGGILFGFDKIRVGIVYNTTKTILDPSVSDYVQTIYTQFSLRI